MKGRPLLPFAIIAIIGILVMISLSFVGLNQRAEMNSEETEEEVTEIEDPIAAGEQMVQASCIGCHGGDLSGGAGPALTSLEGKYSQEEIADIVMKGMGGMPPVNDNEVEADAIAQYLLSISE
ncbi:cytochrome c550 [Halalkalibacterium ligniniphilum]|uniref:cytochrome c550 n=1 Tax=Halalkalibacterium ligniniphilum TaxID=1134413 RepID=UPI000347EE7E|nr:cytochrome c [Halalkalibacterium ligniniphilum]